MIAKIGRSNNMYGALAYNNMKIENQKGEILLMNNMVETPDGKYTVAQLAKSFNIHLVANQNTDKHTVHISLNPDPSDQVSDDQYRELAQLYMHKMGFGKQPFVVFKHTDIDRTHIHIVTVCVDDAGKKISDTFEKIRSMKACRELEKTFGLTVATNKKPVNDLKTVTTLVYHDGNIKSQMASIIRNLSMQYQFQSIGEYNALLSLHNITTEKAGGKLNGKLNKGLLYFPLNEKGKKAGIPFKASLLGKAAGLQDLEKHFETCKKLMSSNPKKQMIKQVINDVLQSKNDEKGFTASLAARGIDTVVHKNEHGRIYGITFIDHHSKTVWNGSKLGKEFSAAIFNEKWKNSKELPIGNNNYSQTSSQHGDDYSTTFSKEAHPLFNFMNDKASEIIDAVGGLLPGIQGEDYDEIDFANNMKKKRQRKRRN